MASGDTYPHEKIKYVCVVETQSLLFREIPRITSQGVHRIHTHSVHDVQYSLLTSTNMKCVLLWLKLNGSDVRNVASLRAQKNPSSGQPCHPLAGLYHTFSFPVCHNRQHHLDSTTFSKTTLYTKNHSRKNLFPKLPGRKATLKNHSRTSIKRVAETRAKTLP